MDWAWSKRAVELSSIALFNNQPYHGPGISLAAADSALLRLLTGNPGLRFRTTNHPTKATANDRIAEFFNKQVHKA